MPCLASLFDAMSGVKKLTNFIHSITCSTSANEPAIVLLAILPATSFTILLGQITDCIWRLKCRSWAIDNYVHYFTWIFDARHGVKMRCQTWCRLVCVKRTRCHIWHRFLTPWLASKTWQTFTCNHLPNFGKRAFIRIKTFFHNAVHISCFAFYTSIIIFDTSVCELWDAYYYIEFLSLFNMI